MQLLYPWFLLGLISLVIPIIIHLLQLRRPQRLLFTNINFIHEVELVTTRQRKIKHLAVLTARVLGLAALVMAFCQPFIVSKKAGSAVQSTNAVDVLIDNSASMSISKKEETVFTLSLAKAKTLGEVYPNARFRLLNNGAVPIGVSTYQSKLAELLPISSEAGVNKSIYNGFNAGDTAPLYVFSDFQRTNFSPAVLKRINATREVVLVPETGARMGNVFVDSVWFDEAFLRMRTNLGLHIRIRNGGNEALNDCPVKVFVGKQLVTAFQVSLAAGQSIISVAQIQLPDQHLMEARVVTGDVQVIFDNTYYFIAQAASTIRVMEVGLAPITRALYKDEPLFSYSFTKPENIDYENLRKANLVLVQEIPVVTDELRDALRVVVARGGSVVIVPNDMASSHRSYQQLFRDLGLGVADWITPSAPPERYELALPSNSEPFFRDILGPQPKIVAMPRVAPVLRWTRTGTDILRFRDGESYLARFTSGAGKVYVFAAPFIKEYSDFTEHALFVPVFYKLAMQSFRSEQRSAYRLSQNSIKLSLPPTGANSSMREERNSLRLMRDSVMWLPVQRQRGDEVQMDLPVGLESPGFYQVQRAGLTLTTLAFNASAKESELATYSAADLRTMIGPNHPNIRVLDGTESSQAMLTQLQAEQNGKPLWRYFLGIALVCLLIEALLLRFGRTQTGITLAAAVA